MTGASAERPGAEEKGGGRSSLPPEGYLGATGRVTTGPAPELLAAGYERELADADVLHAGMGLADIAHVLALDEAGVIPPNQAKALLSALLELDAQDPSKLADHRYGDLFNLRERWLEQRVGRASGWLAFGRPRREAGRVAFRIHLRERLLDLEAAIVRFAAALTEVSDRYRGTPMADYTYLQVAQPTTFGHWLLSFAFPVLRDGERVRGDFGWVNRCPAGAGGVNGSRVALDRQRLAAALAFDEAIEHTRDAMWQTDGFVEAVDHAMLASINASRLAEDLEIWASEGFGFVSLDASYCRASALMPQKRNPYALAVIRGAAGTLIGRAAGLAGTQRTPSGRTDNLLYAYRDVTEAVDLAEGAVALAAGVVETLQIDDVALERPLKAGFACTADLAEALALATGLDHRDCYRVVARAVSNTISSGKGPGAIDPAALDGASRAVLGQPLRVDAKVVADALDPLACIATRTVEGGAAQAPMSALLERAGASAVELGAWAEERRGALRRAEDALRAAAETQAARGGLPSEGQRPPGSLSLGSDAAPRERG